MYIHTYISSTHSYLSNFLLSFSFSFSDCPDTVNYSNLSTGRNSHHFLFASTMDEVVGSVYNHPVYKYWKVYKVELFLLSLSYRLSLSNICFQAVITGSIILLTNCIYTLFILSSSSNILTNSLVEWFILLICFSTACSMTLEALTQLFH